MANLKSTLPTSALPQSLWRQPLWIGLVIARQLQNIDRVISLGRTNRWCQPSQQSGQRALHDADGQRQSANPSN
jgi:hypothetical protein